MSKISNNEYKKILRYYKLPIPTSKHRIKTIAENILTKKYCSCIQKVKRESGSKLAIPVCTKSVLQKKKLHRGSFTCKKKPNGNLFVAEDRGVLVESKALLLYNFMNSLQNLRFHPCKKPNVYPNGTHTLTRDTLCITNIFCFSTLIAVVMHIYIAPNALKMSILWGYCITTNEACVVS